ncbi:MAG: hypothetical protein PHC97_00615 [Patescibacteria group bacterium]|nr:hypothetical protein [Patescibacteria group bacterium]
MVIKKIIQKTKELIEKNQFILYLAIFAAALFVGLWLQSSPTFLDPDSFYHLKMAKLIAANFGPIINFPWLKFTLLANDYVDHHFLYHVLAIPFIKILGDLAGLKFYTVILSAALVLLSYWFFKKYKVVYAGIFALVLLFSPAFLFRVSLVKGNSFSLILLFLGIYCVFKKRYWLLFLLSFIYVWSYGGFLLILLMSGVYSFSVALWATFNDSYSQNSVKYFFKVLFSPENLKPIIFSALGIILGICANPYFPGNISFYWQQLVQIGLINYRGVVNVGGEWYPYPPLQLIGDAGLVLMFFSLAVMLFFVFIKKQKPETIFFFIASLIFLALTLKSKRYVEYFIPFVVYFSALATTLALGDIKIKDLISKIENIDKRLGRLLILIFIYLLVIIPLVMVKDAYITFSSFRGGISFTRFSGVSAYLEKNTNQGDVIMHTSWDDFPMLFYYNSKDYYIVGLDPTFMYNYSPSLYNLYADITMAKINTNLYQQIKDNFGAKYFVVNSGRDALEKNLQNDGNFTKVYEDSDGKIYKLK